MQSNDRAYIISRGGKRPRYKRRRKRGAGLLVCALLVLSAAATSLAYFLPRVSKAGAPIAQAAVFYLMATAKSDNYLTALENAQYAAERGGAGALFNDGENFHAVATVTCDRATATALASVNENSYIITLSVPVPESGDGDTELFNSIIEFFNAVTSAAENLDRGSISQSAAMHSHDTALAKVISKRSNAMYYPLAHVAEDIADSAKIGVGARSMPSYLRYIASGGVIALYNALCLP